MSKLPQDGTIQSRLMQRLVEAQRLANLGHWELDLVENNLIWSEQIFHIFEIDQVKFSASYEAFLAMVHPDDRDAVNKAYTDSLISRQPYQISHRLLMPDGRIKWVNERCETTFADDGTPLRSIGTVQDITDRVRIEQELRDLNHSLERRVSDRTYELASERNFVNTILETAGALILVLDKDGRVIRFNRACEQLTGYSQKEIKGEVIWNKLIPPEQVAEVRNVIEQLLTTRQPSQYENEWLSKDGHRYLVAWSNSTIVGQPDDSLYVIATGIDITARKAAERELIKARDVAELANRTKSEFLARMSHELRTPLNAILGFSQLLSSDTTSPLTEIQAEYVKEVLQAGTHLLELVNDVLDLSRIEADRLQISMADIALCKVLRDSIALMQPIAGQRKVVMQTEFNVSDDLCVMADATRLRQVLVNLISNAIKYNRDGGQVRINCKTSAGGFVRISVADTGPGLSEVQQERLFNPFERLDADRQAIQGTGIGLALSKHLMHMMDGQIGVESTLGEGSTFWIRLKIAGSDQQTAEI